MACIYFAGEEVSWGQWYFLWDTPEVFQEINDQNETNLHNTSSWLDQKPRFVVELFIFISGFIWPILRFFGLRPQRTTEEWHYWISVSGLCFSAAALFTVVRLCGWSDNSIILNFGNTEFRELIIALVLTLYLSSFWFRLRVLARDSDPSG
ncbi:hypothetical protein [Solemya velesiana gill symbiont]|uniref:Uncharacterized protein n=1 Tax=Solemya velesiana gill symbiont TaxID=1918948 RepID=A0A1T2KRR9_9GAMM|nr:hypothetical protein [Solemya velesiana gill symbiont]OOZ35386.1 hypothetical protein BOW51_11415 [Solemya velesiana gill symbiont]